MAVANMRAASRDNLIILTVASTNTGYSEIKHTNAAVIADDYIVWLEITVDQACGMCSRKASPCLDKLLEHLSTISTPVLEPQPKRPSANILHREENSPSEFTDIVHLHDIWMRELRQRLGLTKHARYAATGGGPVSCRPQELDRNPPLELVIIRIVDNPHPPHSKDADNHISFNPVHPT